MGNERNGFNLKYQPCHSPVSVLAGQLAFYLGKQGMRKYVQNRKICVHRETYSQAHQSYKKRNLHNLILLDSTNVHGILFVAIEPLSGSPKRFPDQECSDKVSLLVHNPPLPRGCLQEKKFATKWQYRSLPVQSQNKVRCCCKHAQGTMVLICIAQETAALGHTVSPLTKAYPLFYFISLLCIRVFPTTY